jgi:hypothetical protein
MPTNAVDTRLNFILQLIRSVNCFIGRPNSSNYNASGIVTFKGDLQGRESTRRRTVGRLLCESVVVRGEVSTRTRYVRIGKRIE